jgi:uncharacterized DUF497 family protein
MEFDWDTNKAIANLKRYNVSFKEAATVFGDPLSITILDPDHSIDEQRYIITGSSYMGRLLMVAHTDRGESIRIISARELTRKERKAYEEGGFI